MLVILSRVILWKTLFSSDFNLAVINENLSPMLPELKIIRKELGVITNHLAKQTDSCLKFDIFQAHLIFGYLIHASIRLNFFEDKITLIQTFLR